MSQHKPADDVPIAIGIGHCMWLKTIKINT